MRIDAHQHFWQLAARAGGWPPPSLCAIYRDFAPADLAPLLAAHGVQGTVLVQSLPSEDDTHWLLALAEQADFIRAVVGWTDLLAPDAPAAIARLASHKKLKGLRPMLEKAYNRNNTKHKVVGGGSTITQQLAKNLFLSGSRSYLRKGQELVITYMLETLMEKERIFEIYLNVVEFGTGTFGAEAASRHYYRASAASLNAGQAARLAVMLPNPRYYDKHRDTNYLNRRTATILARMGSAELP